MTDTDPHGYQDGCAECVAEAAPTEYLVVWSINIEATSPMEAAKKALDTQRNPESIATVFDVEWDDSASGEGRKVAIDLHLGTVHQR